MQGRGFKSKRAGKGDQGDGRGAKSRRGGVRARVLAETTKGVEEDRRPEGVGGDRWLVVACLRD